MNDKNVDQEMNNFLREHFVQGSLVSANLIRDSLAKIEDAIKKENRLPEGFKNGWESAFKMVFATLEKVMANMPKNYLKDDEEFDRLYARFQEAFPKK